MTKAFIFIAAFLHLTVASSALAYTPDAPTDSAKIMARRFIADKQKGGMFAVVADIQKCYAASIQPIPLPAAVRKCMVLDMVGFQTDEAMQKIAPGVGGIEFFNSKQLGMRYDRYGPFAKFPNVHDGWSYLTVRANDIFAEIIKFYKQQKQNQPIASAKAVK